eukprot:m.460969 g.460969  ORF g.460969 m.460969 type:complete len:97 (+) comp22180_c0_seq1:1211-1501(+)
MSSVSSIWLFKSTARSVLSMGKELSFDGESATPESSSAPSPDPILRWYSPASDLTPVARIQNLNRHHFRDVEQNTPHQLSVSFDLSGPRCRNITRV